MLLDSAAATPHTVKVSMSTGIIMTQPIQPITVLATFNPNAADECPLASSMLPVNNVTS